MSRTLHVPGVHVMAIESVVAVPVQLCGPLTVTLPSGVNVPVKPSKGAPRVSEQFVWLTDTGFPMSEASQCAVTFHIPAMIGHCG